MRLEGRRILVTAASGPTGETLSLLLAQEGARLALTSRRAESLAPLASRLGLQATPLEGDPTDEVGARRLAEGAVAALGGLDGLVYNVGGSLSGEIRTADTPTADWERMVRSHVQGAFFILRIALPHLVQAGGGSAVVIGASEGTRRRANVSYSVAKGALVPLVQKVAREYREQGVRVNLVQPRSIEERPTSAPVRPPPGALTGNPLPEDLAFACLYFLSAESRMVTGQVLTVDGGREL